MRQRVKQELKVKSKQRYAAKLKIKTETRPRSARLWAAAYPVYGNGRAADEYENLRYPTGVSLPNAIRSIDKIEKSIRDLTPSKIRPNNYFKAPIKTNNPIKLDHRTIPELYTPVKPWQATPVKPDEKIKLDTKIAPILKVIPALTPTEIIPQALKPILNEISVVKQTYKERLNIISLQDNPFYPKKKKETQRDVRKNNRERIHLKRDLGNRLGSLDSMFGGSSRKSGKTAKHAKRA